VQGGATSWEQTDGGQVRKKKMPITYVPIEPCQPVISALRTAAGEHLACEFIDLENTDWQPKYHAAPDPYALKKITLDQYAAGVMPGIPRPTELQEVGRLNYLAARLHQLEKSYQKILFICAMSEWIWIREAYQLNKYVVSEFGQDEVEEAMLYRADADSLVFLLDELPFIASLYERARYELEDDFHLSVEGIKELLLAARERYQEEFGKRARKITPAGLAQYLRYVRNLSLVEHRLTPDMYTLVMAAKQFFGDQFAISLMEKIRSYPWDEPSHLETFRLSADKGQLPDGTLVKPHNRLPGTKKTWRSCDLMPQPPKLDKQKFQRSWNPYGQCSWPAEDFVIERFRTHIQQTALQMLGNDLVKTEKFTTSLKDGLDMRDTLRHWHTGDLYVKEIPPSRGNIDCVIMLFDSPADPRDYPYRITWHAEHHDESTLSFFASNYMTNIIAPGIAQANYGGAMFLFPPRDVRNIWHDKKFDFVDTLEERLLVSGCNYAYEKHVVIMSDAAPGRSWHHLAAKYGKKILHVPISKFSQETIANLRSFHVLNGQEVRSYAAHFIRKP
jgi:hypothetical protein